MLALLRVFLPFDIHLSCGETLSPITVAEQDNGLRVTIHPPYASKAKRDDSRPTVYGRAVEAFAAMDRDDSPSPVENVRLDGSACVVANCLQIDFAKAEFDRRIPSSGPEYEQTDPPLEYMFGLINKVVESFRALGKVAFLRSFSHDQTSWVLLYCNDDLTELPRTEGLLRGRHGTARSWQVFGLNRSLWQKVSENLLTAKLPTWERLFFDALSILPEIGPAIILGFSAVETLASVAMDALSKDKLPPTVWDWITERKPYFHRPNTEQLLDVFIKAFSGNSLKESQALWKSFTDLNKARNNYAHRGELTIDGKPIDLHQARDLIGGVGGILDWIESRLPPEMRRAAPLVGTRLEIIGRL
jgi:hypothetical protein